MKSVPRFRNLVVILVGGFLSFLQTGCQEDVTGRDFAEQTMGGSAPPIETPPEGEMRLSQYEPNNPHVEVASGTLSQTVFQTGEDSEAVGGFQVEVRNLLVGPGRSSEELNLPGGTVFEVRSGAGVVTIGGESQQVTVGSTFTVSQGDGFRLENTSEMALAIRAYVIRRQ